MNEKAPRSSHGAFLEANSARGRPWGGFNYAELWDPNPRGGFRFLTNRSYAQGFEVSELIGEPVPRSECPEFNRIHYPYFWGRTASSASVQEFGTGDHVGFRVHRRHRESPKMSDKLLAAEDFVDESHTRAHRYVGNEVAGVAVVRQFSEEVR